MAKKYYLANGESGEATGLKLLVDGTLKRDFDDISDLDIQTMELPFDKAKDILQEYNEKVKFGQHFFDVEYPFRDFDVKTSPTIFDYQGTDLTKLYNSLRHFAELRSRQKKTGQSVALEHTNELNDYYRSLLYKIIQTNDKHFYDRDRLYSSDLREAICDKMLNKQHIKIEDYISSILYSSRINGTLHNYTQLRLLFIEYANYLKQLQGYTSRTNHNTFDTYHFQDLKHYDEYAEGQLTLFDVYGEEINPKKNKS
ncbi:MAG: hypothetical protein K5666_01680 [Bacilli bacterium]|nr:hypothetical protein [Bacilli bacterium]